MQDLDFRFESRNSSVGRRRVKLLKQYKNNDNTIWVKCNHESFCSLHDLSVGNYEQHLAWSEFWGRYSVLCEMTDSVRLVCILCSMCHFQICLSSRMYKYDLVWKQLPLYVLFYCQERLMCTKGCVVELK